MAADLHPDVAAFAPLLGMWRGDGTGDFPTIEPFAYREELEFEHVGDTFLLYRQESWGATDDAPLHFERGFLRPGAGAGDVELCLAHPIGVTEIAHGRLDGGTMEVAAEGAAVVRSATGLEVRALRRRYELDGDELRYTLEMATDAVPLTHHLTARLRRVT